MVQQRIRTTQCRRWTLAGLFGLAGFLAAGAVWWYRHAESNPQAAPAYPREIPRLPVTASPFLNTKPEAHYVGSTRCRECHVGHAASFHRTGMGRSMATADPDRAPPDAVVDHPKSKRRYHVQRREGKLWHRELLLTGGPEEVVLAEHPLKYVVGSGRHSLTYLAEIDGFLVESPLTWYAARQAWDMSPGYDRPIHSGFERPIGESCLTCHAGQVEAVDHSVHRIRVPEPVISCERCHGPGSLHVKRHREREGALEKSPNGFDVTIVNPAHLPRELAEAVCQQCHLRPSASVVARGRKEADFRPGLPIQEFVHYYRLDVPHTPMTVVGHVEQMHLSKCYQKSEKFTCSSCHNPHGEPKEKDRDEHYRAICLSCHQNESCKVDAARRKKESPANRCVQCHMPTSETEIPHLAFTHHRVGIFEKANAEAPNPEWESAEFGDLKPLLPLPPLHDLDRKRSLGLGYLEVAASQKDPVLIGRFQERALTLLSKTRAEGLRDPLVDVSLATLHFDMGLGQVLPLAQSAWEHSTLNGDERANALYLLADAEAKLGRPAIAKKHIGDLLKLRRKALDWLLLAKCEGDLGNAAGARQAQEAAVRIDTRLYQVHRNLADYYRRQGDEARAAWHAKRAGPP